MRPGIRPAYFSKPPGPLLAELRTSQHRRTSLIEFCLLVKSGHSLKEGDFSCFRPEGEHLGHQIYRLNRIVVGINLANSYSELE